MTSAANIMARWRSRLQPEWDRTSVTLLANRGAIEPVSKTNGIDRGIFTSVADLKRKIVRYIRLYQKTAKPFQWKYSDVRKRIPAW